MILSLKRHSSFSIALINPCCSHSFPVRVFCFRCPSMQPVALFFYSDNFSYATNLHKKIKQQQQQRQQRQRPRRKIVALLFFFICIGRWGRGTVKGYFCVGACCCCCCFSFYSYASSIYIVYIDIYANFVPLLLLLHVSVFSRGAWSACCPFV